MTTTMADGRRPAKDVPASDPRQFYSVTDLATQLGTPRGTVYGWVAEGIIPHVKVGRRVYIPIAAWEAWIAARTEAGSPAPAPAPAPEPPLLSFPVPRSRHRKQL